MQFRDLGIQYQEISEEINAAFKDVCMRSDFIQGQCVGELEKILADYVGRKYCITCANGTDALQLALMALGVKNTDAVFVPDFTFFSSGEAPAVIGAVPVFVDVDYGTCNMCPEALETAVQKVAADGRLVPKAVLAVDLFGQPAEYGRIIEIARKYQMHVVEDGAQGFGGRIGAQKACSFGDISTTSFFPAKPLGCYGDGGAVFTDDDGYAELIRSLAVHGKGADKYDNVRLGMNSRLDTIQAAILKVKFQKFAEYELEAVNRAANIYGQELEGKVEIPIIQEGYYSSWAQYTIKLPAAEVREKLQHELHKEGIPSMIYYPKPMHTQEAFGLFKNIYGGLYFENMETEMLCRRVLQLPLHPYMKESEILKVCEIVEKSVSRAEADV